VSAVSILQAAFFALFAAGYGTLAIVMLSRGFYSIMIELLTLYRSYRLYHPGESESIKLVAEAAHPSSTVATDAVGLIRFSRRRNALGELEVICSRSGSVFPQR
jgi:hypothetical protein